MKFVIVIDAQNDFITGPLGTPEAVEIYERMKIALPNLCDNNTRVIFTRDTHYLETYDLSEEGQRLPIPHCIKDSTGWEIAPSLTEITHKWNYYVIAGEPCIVNKTTFGSTALPNYIEYKSTDRGDSVEEIIIVGFCTDICVINNAMILKAHFPEAKIKVVESLCAGTTPENHQKALDIMKQCHIDIV